MAEALAQWHARSPGGATAELTGGLRAEHLRLAPATNRNLSAEVSHCEALGNEQLLTCRLLEGDHLVQLRAEPDQALVPGQTVHLEVEASGWRLFDAAGEAIPRPEPQVLKGPEPVLPHLG
jgi:multiple sugar transport system ATP-binding protein